MEKPTFTRVNLADVRLIIEIMHVLMDESLNQVVMGGISVLESPFVWCTWVPAVMSFHARY
jgi:hypothetical protein